jgi:ribonuclease PH
MKGMAASVKRIDGRAPDQIRPIEIQTNFLSHPLSSVLIACGGTRVVCAVSVENKVPPWMKAQKVPGGWITCEYGMLPASTHERMRREASAGKPGGRTMEIQRLIGRAMRSVVKLEALGENTIYLDCDVIDADGGTRCAGISGAATALALALKCGAPPLFPPDAMIESIAAVSVGIVDGVPLLDLCYEEDCRAEVDMNVVMTESGKFVEVQGTAERRPFDRNQLNELLELAEHGLKQIFARQREVMASVAAAAKA